MATSNANRAERLKHAPRDDERDRRHDEHR